MLNKNELQGACTIYEILHIPQLHVHVHVHVYPSVVLMLWLSVQAEKRINLY